MKSNVWLDNSRILSMFAVVLLHVAARVVTRNEIGSMFWWYGNVYDSLVRWCVPVFVMISGALLLDPNKIEDLATFYKKRVVRIFVPIIFWSLIFLALSSFENDDFTTSFLLQRLLFGAPYYHMWFLYMIIILYLFTPYFRKIIAISSRLEIVFLVIISFIISILNTAYKEIYSVASSANLFIIVFLPYVPYFFAGYLIRTYDRQIPKKFLWTIFLTSFVLTFLGCYFLGIWRGFSIGLYFYKYLSITVVPMSISIFFLLKSWEKPILNHNFTKLIASLTLGAYLIHIIFLEAIIKAGFGPNSFLPSISIPMISVVVFTISLICALLISKVPFFNRTI